MNVVLDDTVVFAAAAQPQGISSNVSYLAFLDGALNRAIGHHRRGHRHRGLRIAVPLFRESPIRMPEGKTTDLYVFHELALICISIETEQFAEHRNDHLGGVQLFSRQRHVVNDTGLWIAVPLARRIEGLESILHVKALVGIPSERTENSGAGEGDDALLFIDGSDAYARGVPRMENDHLDIVKLFPWQDVTRLEAKLVHALVPFGTCLGIDQPLNFEVACVWRSRPNGSPAVDEKLTGNDFSCHLFRQLRLPHSAFCFLPFDDASAA